MTNTVTGIWALEGDSVTINSLVCFPQRSGRKKNSLGNFPQAVSPHQLDLVVCLPKKG